MGTRFERGVGLGGGLGPVGSLSVKKVKSVELSLCLSALCVWAFSMSFLIFLTHTVCAASHSHTQPLSLSANLKPV